MEVTKIYYFLSDFPINIFFRFRNRNFMAITSNVIKEKKKNFRECRYQKYGKGKYENLCTNWENFKPNIYIASYINGWEFIFQTFKKNEKKFTFIALQSLNFIYVFQLVTVCLTLLLYLLLKIFTLSTNFNSYPAIKIRIDITIAYSRGKKVK